MNRVVTALQIAGVGALLTLGVATKAQAGTCHPIFVAGQGVLDSCTGEHWDSERYAPPEPTVIYVVVSPTINVSVSPVISVSNVVSNTANASSFAASGSSSTVKVVTKPKHFPPKVAP